MRLASFADAQMRETFVGTVEGRGFNGKRRTVLLREVRLFGSKFIFEDHLWVHYDKRWERIEPFYQGQKMVLVGTAIEYMRKNNTCDYTLALEKVTKLWPSLNQPKLIPSSSTYRIQQDTAALQQKNDR